MPYIHCAILGDGTIFRVHVNDDKSVLELKEEIAAGARDKLGTNSPANLNLYHVDIEISEDGTARNVREIISRGSMDAFNSTELDNPFSEMKEIFKQGPPGSKKIHIIVECERTHSGYW